MAERQAGRAATCLRATLANQERCVAPSSHQIPFCGAVQEVGTSVPPSSEKRSSKPPKVGFCTNFPASRHSPGRNAVPSGLQSAQDAARAVRVAPLERIGVVGREVYTLRPQSAEARIEFEPELGPLTDGDLF